MAIQTKPPVEVRRIAKERHLTISRAEQEAQENLNTAYRRFLKEQEPAKKEEAGQELIRAIFGKDAIAKDSIL